MTRQKMNQKGRRHERCAGPPQARSHRNAQHGGRLIWMSTQGAKLDPGLVAAKVGDYGVEGYEDMLDEAIKRLPAIVNSPGFKAQMTRFIDSSTVSKTLDREGYLDYLSTLVGKLFSKMRFELAEALQAVQTQASASQAGVAKGRPGKKKLP